MPPPLPRVWGERVKVLVLVPFQASGVHCHSHQSLQDLKQDAQLSQRDRVAGGVIVFAKSGKLEDNILYTDIIGLSSTTVI